MEITLNEQDMEKLAATLERRISDRVIGLLAAGPVFEALSERARLYVDAYISENEFKHQAVEAFKESLQKDGKSLLREVVAAAVSQVHGDDPDLKKAVARGVYEAARDHAESLRDAED